MSNACRGNAVPLLGRKSPSRFDLSLRLNVIKYNQCFAYLRGDAYGMFYVMRDCIVTIALCAVWVDGFIIIATGLRDEIV